MTSIELTERLERAHQRLQRFQEYHEAQLSQMDRRWLHLALHEVQRYRAELSHPLQERRIALRMRETVPRWQATRRTTRHLAQVMRSRGVACTVHVGLLCLIYVSTAKLGLSLDAVSGFATAVWPPTGLALAALILGGFRLWPGIALGAFLVNLSAGAPLLVAGGMAIGNTLEALVGTWLLHRVVGFHPCSSLPPLACPDLGGAPVWSPWGSDGHGDRLGPRDLGNGAGVWSFCARDAP